MNVYLLFYNDYNDYELLGVYSTKSGAEKAMNIRLDDSSLKWYNKDTISIVEKVVIEGE